VKDNGKSIHALFEQRLDRFRRHVAAGEAGAAGGDDDVDARIGDPRPDDGADRFDVVGDDLACRQSVPRRGQPVEPDLSSANERVSEIVSTAMSSAMNCFDSSMEDIAKPFADASRGTTSKPTATRC
jgi:hypothetical protein